MSGAKVFRILILVVLILVVIGSTIALVYMNYGKLQPENLENTIYNFTSTSGNSANLKCPVGSVINVLDAWYEVYDPYFQCTPYPTPGAMGLTTSGSVTDKNKNLGSGWNEIDGSTKNPFTGVKYDKSPDDTFNFSKCQFNISSSGTPSPASGSSCQPYNSLGFLIENVNGVQEATISPDVNSQGGTTGGPAPCLGMSSGDLALLPIGGQYNEDNTGGTKFADGYQGYYIHGVYSCVPSDS